MTWSIVPRLALAATLPLAIVACVVDSSDGGSRGVTVTGAGAGGPTQGGGAQGTTGTGAPSDHPILATIDTNQTMNAAPGDGVGVFTEYVAGGHWHIWWTCDTNKNGTNAPCSFDVKVTVASGSFKGATAEHFESTDTFTSSPQQIEGVTTTSTGTDGFLFDTDPGATITLSASIGGVYDGGFLFFVQDGKINDGFSGTVTDPIQLVPSSP